MQPAGDHQRKNAFAYARIGACEVMEENNLTAKLFIEELDRLFGNMDAMRKMSIAAAAFAKKDAAYKIAGEIVTILKKHMSYDKRN